MSGLGEIAYTGVATYGRFNSVIGAVIGIIIMIALIFIGYRVASDVHTDAVNATVTRVYKGGHVSSADNRWSGTIDLTYVYQGKTYTSAARQVTSDTAAAFVVGTRFELYVDPRNPDDLEQRQVTTLGGYAIALAGLAIGGVSIGFAYLSFKSKEFAAFQGSLGAVNALRGH